MKIQKFIGSNFRSGAINFLLVLAANEKTSDQVSCCSQSLVILPYYLPHSNSAMPKHYLFCSTANKIYAPRQL